jgi:hypothetical protein
MILIICLTAVFIAVISLFPRLRGDSTPFPELLKSAPHALSSKDCFFCGHRLSMRSNRNLQRYVSLSPTDLLTGHMTGYLFPFCHDHDPLQLASPLPPGLFEILANGRYAVQPYEDTRSKNAKTTGRAFARAGTRVGVFSGHLLAGAGLAAAGAIVAHLTNAPEEIQEVFSKNQDLLLQINLVEFDRLRKSHRFVELKASAFSPLKKSIAAVESHLHARIKLIRGLDQRTEYVQVIQDSQDALKELEEIKERVRSVLEERDGAFHAREDLAKEAKRAKDAVEAKESKEAKAREQQLVEGLTKLKQAHMAGLLTDEIYHREAEDLKRKASA